MESSLRTNRGRDDMTATMWFDNLSTVEGNREDLGFAGNHIYTFSTVFLIDLRC